MLLCTSQWALNGRKKLPTIADFRDTLVTDATAMIAGARELREAVLRSGHGFVNIVCLNRTTNGLEGDAAFADGRTASVSWPS